MKRLKNKAVNSVEYTGIVTLSQYTKTRRKKQIARFYNSGGYSLFNFFADCLIGDFSVAKLHRPTKIMLLHKETDQDTNVIQYRDLSGFIYQTSQPEKVYSATKSIVRYTFIIPKDLVNTIDINMIDCIGLYANSAQEGDVNDYSAIVSVKLDDSEVSASSAVLAEWDLIISNKTDSNDAQEEA